MCSGAGGGGGTRIAEQLRSRLHARALRIRAFCLTLSRSLKWSEPRGEHCSFVLRCFALRSIPVSLYLTLCASFVSRTQLYAMWLYSKCVYLYTSLGIDEKTVVLSLNGIVLLKIVFFIEFLEQRFKANLKIC